MNIFIDIEILP